MFVDSGSGTFAFANSSVSMKKYILDLRVVSVCHVHDRYVLLKLTADFRLPEMLPGQFVEIKVDESPNTCRRRPISIHFVDRERNELWLLVATIGDGTRRLSRLQTGDGLNAVPEAKLSFPASMRSSIPS